MKKFLLIGMALVAMLAVPSVASADVARCEASVPTSTVIKTATFTVYQPAGLVGQWENVWKHDYTVTINPETGTFAGVGDVYDQNGAYSFSEDISGSFGNGTVTYTSGRTPFNFVDSYSVLNALTDATSKDAGTVNIATSNPAVGWVLEARITNPVITETVTTTPGTESVKNHGQFVKAQGGGKTAAQACAGMPLVSTQGVTVLN